MRLIGFVWFSILHLSANYCVAQTFYREYGTNGINEGGQAVIASPDGNLFTGGFKNDSAMILKTDLSGNILWTVAFVAVQGMPNVIHQLDISPDNYLIGIGNAFDIPNSRYKDGFVFKMDLQGNLIWINAITDSRPIKYESLHAYSVSSYIVFAEIYDVPSASYPDPASLQIDAVTGTVTSYSPRYDYITSNPYIDDHCASTINSSGNAIYSTGRIYVGGASTSSMRAYLSKYDLNGTMIATSYLSWNASASARIYGADIAYNNDSIAVCYFGDIAGSSTNFTIGVIRTDTNGIIAWSKNYDIAGSTSEMCYRLLPNPGGYFVVGFTQSGANDYFILSIDLNGNVLWTKGYGGAASTENLKEYYTPNATIIGSNIYFTGQSINAGSSNLIIAVADFSGNITCDPPTILNTTSSNNPLVRTLLTPGAISDNLNFSMPVISPTYQPLNDICAGVVLDLGNDTTLCSNVTLNATIPGATSYIWQDGSTNSTNNVISSGIYWVTVQVNCCTYSDTITFSPGSLPTANFSVLTNTCSGQAAFTNTSGGATSYVWDFGDNTTSIQNSPIHQYSQTGNYTVTIIAINNCGADTMQTPVIVSGIFSVQINPSSVTLCSNDTATLLATSTGGSGPITWLWTPSSQTTSSIFITATSSATYIVISTDSLGCTASDTANVSVYASPSLSVGNSPTICPGQQTTLSATASNGGPYVWSNNLGTNPNVQVSPNVTTTYYVSIYDSCAATWITDSIIVFVMPPSVVVFSLDSSSGCAPLTVHFTDFSTTPQDQIVAWIWDFGDGDSSFLTSPSHTYSSPGTYYVTLSVVTSSGCVTTLVSGATITVHPLPIAGFTWQQYGAAGEQTQIQFTDASIGASTIQWQFGDSTTGSTSNPNHTYAETGDFTVTQIVSNVFGCTDTAIIELSLTGEFTIYIPNTFTPGADGINSTFGAIGVGIASYHMLVFDRWGMLIFESNDYYNQWDGTLKGNKVQTDTYVYVIDVLDYLGGEHNFIGHVNLIR